MTLLDSDSFVIQFVVMNLRHLSQMLKRNSIFLKERNLWVLVKAAVYVRPQLEWRKCKEEISLVSNLALKEKFVLRICMQALLHDSLLSLCDLMMDFYSVNFSALFDGLFLNHRLIFESRLSFK